MTRGRSFVLTLLTCSDAFSAWISEFLVFASSSFKDASLGEGSVPQLTQLREKSAQFEAQVRSSFQANPRFVDQYFDKSDFAYDATICESILEVLEEHFRSIADSFSTIASRPISGFNASSPESLQLIELISSYAHISRGLRNLATQVNIRTKPHKTSYLPYFLEAPLELIRLAKDISSPEIQGLKASLQGLSRSIFQLATNMSVLNSGPNLELIYAHILPAWVWYVETIFFNEFLLILTFTVLCLPAEAASNWTHQINPCMVHYALSSTPLASTILCACMYLYSRSRRKNQEPNPSEFPSSCDFITDEEEFHRFISYCSSLHKTIEGDLDSNMMHWLYVELFQKDQFRFRVNLP